MPIGSIFAAVAAPIVGNIVGQVIGGDTQAQGQAQGAQQQGIGLQNAAGALTNAYQNAGPFLTNAYNTSNTALTNAYNTGTGALNSGYQNAIGGYSPYQATGASATNAINNMIGSGYATNQFNNQDLYNGLSPNYNFMLGQGQNANNAAANVGGGMLSGNALQGLDTFTQNYAQNAYQQAFNNYQNQRNSIFSNVGGAAGQGLSATNQVGNLYSNQGNTLANLAANYGGAQTALNTGYGGSQANLNTSYGSALAGNYGQQGAVQGAGTIGQANATGNMYANTGTALGALAGNYFSQPSQSSFGNSGMSSGMTQGMAPGVAAPAAATWNQAFGGTTGMSGD